MSGLEYVAIAALILITAAAASQLMLLWHFIWGENVEPKWFYISFSITAVGILCAEIMSRGEVHELESR